MPSVSSASRCERAAITLLEVLISIGILAVGLSSVLALVPAARSQASRAVVLDRAGTLAANVLADAATYGLFRADKDCFVMWNGTAWVAMGDPPFLMSDPDAVIAGAPSVASGTSVQLKQTGIYGVGAAVASGPAFHRLIFQGRDDVVVRSGADDEPPTNLLIDDTRAFEGRMSSLLCISRFSPAQSLASVIVFHARDPDLVGSGVGGPLVTGTMVSANLTVQTADLRGKKLNELIRPGVVVCIAGTLHQLTGANVSGVVTGESTTSASAFLASAKDLQIGASASPTIIQFLPDSVGLAERVFTPEAPGLFSQ